MSYSWEVLSREQLRDVLTVSKEVQKPAIISDHWLSEGEIWTLCGLEKYGQRVRLSTNALFQRSVATIAGSISELLTLRGK